MSKFVGWSWAGSPSKGKRPEIEVLITYIADDGMTHKVQRKIHSDWFRYDTDELRPELVEFIKKFVEEGP